jgi:hypothetical protein
MQAVNNPDLAALVEEARDLLTRVFRGLSANPNQFCARGIRQFGLALERAMRFELTTLTLAT